MEGATERGPLRRIWSSVVLGVVEVGEAGGFGGGESLVFVSCGPLPLLLPGGWEGQNCRIMLAVD